MKPLWTLLLCACSAAAQPLSFSLLQAEGAKPSGRVDGTIAYDPQGRRIFLFGGQSNATLNDLWVYSLAERRWTELQPAGTKPAARFGHTLIYDPARRQLVVFGGQAGGFFSDVWAFDIGRGEWRQLAPGGAGPSNRYGHSAIYDSARDRMIVSHGFTNAGRFDDTWAFDLASNRWQNLDPQGARPLRRCLHHAVYNGADQMLLYGGCASGFGPCPLDDLWVLDLNTNRWTEKQSTPRPRGREHYGIVFDTVRERLILFGGQGGAVLNDTWLYDPRASSWREAVIAGPVPDGRSRHESAYAADRGTAFFFGGSTAAGLSNELWMLGAGFAVTRPEISRGGLRNAFSGDNTAMAPGEIVSIFGSNLGPLEPVTFAFDPLTAQLPVSGPGVNVTFNGIAAPFYFASGGQLNVQAPYELAGAAEARVVVTVNGQAGEAEVVPVAQTHPGLHAAVFNQDGTLNSAANPAATGTAIVLFATGQGVTIPASRTGAAAREGVFPAPAAEVSLTVGGVAAEVLFRGQAPGTAGVMQVNAVIPEGMAAGAKSVVLRVGAAESAPVTVFVR